MNVICITFIGGSQLEFEISNADTVAGNFKNNAWVELEGYKIQSSNIAYIKTSKKKEVRDGKHEAFGRG